MKKVCFTSDPKLKVNHLRHPGNSRAQPWRSLKANITIFCTFAFLWFKYFIYFWAKTPFRYGSKVNPWAVFTKDTATPNPNTHQKTQTEKYSVENFHMAGIVHGTNHFPCFPHRWQAQNQSRNRITVIIYSMYSTSQVHVFSILGAYHMASQTAGIFLVSWINLLCITTPHNWLKLMQLFHPTGSD